MTSRVRIHAKVLTSPSVPLTTVFHNMREVYATLNIDVGWATEEALNLPALNVVEVANASGARLRACLVRFTLPSPAASVSGGSWPPR